EVAGARELAETPSAGPPTVEEQRDDVLAELLHEDSTEPVVESAPQPGTPSAPEPPTDVDAAIIESLLDVEQRKSTSDPSSDQDKEQV
ncbi:MAG: hypothetical protein IH926_09510, partial [Proteobacteria bacterium]|nr:hypothetical protein [Pseudomonadota bacterium]